MNASFGSSEVDQSTMQLIIDQLEELVVTLIEEVRERPGVAVALFAAVVGAVIGGMLATGNARPKPVRKRVTAKLDNVGDMASLIGLGVNLMENPIVRGYVLAALSGQLKKRFNF